MIQVRGSVSVAGIGNAPDEGLKAQLPKRCDNKHEDKTQYVR